MWVALAGLCPCTLTFTQASALGPWIFARFKCCLAFLSTKASPFGQSVHFQSHFQPWVTSLQILVTPMGLCCSIDATVFMLHWYIDSWDHMLCSLPPFQLFSPKNYWASLRIFFSLPYLNCSKVPMFMARFEHSISVHCYFSFYLKPSWLEQWVSRHSFAELTLAEGPPDPLCARHCPKVKQHGAVNLRGPLSSWNSNLAGETDGQQVIKEH